MKIFRKGKRGIITIKFFNGNKVAVKEQRKDSKAINKIEDEARWLKKLNKHGIGPMLINYENGKLVMEFVHGESVLNWFKKAPEEDRKAVLREVMRQCRIMDKLGVSKGEMHKPVKHILISDGKAVMIDFERCRVDRKPKNVTQFGTFLVKIGFGDLVRVKESLKEYRRRFDEESFRRVLRAFGI